MCLQAEKEAEIAQLSPPWFQFLAAQTYSFTTSETVLHPTAVLYTNGALSTRQPHACIVRFLHPPHTSFLILPKA
jgi:hypothetical protein